MFKQNLAILIHTTTNIEIMKKSKDNVFFLLESRIGLISTDLPNFCRRDEKGRERKDKIKF